MLSKIDILGSSSDGNAYVLSFDTGKKIQLDAGVKNVNAKDIMHCCISHSHIDHNKYEKDFDTEQIYKSAGSDIENLDIGLKITSFKVPHAVKTLGFYIEYDGEKIVYITDCADWQQLRDVWMFVDKPTLIMVECNWDYFGVKEGTIDKQDYSDYALSNHMSNLDCLNLLSKFNITKDTKIMFLHKSKNHANYETTYKMFDSLPNKKYIAREGETLYVKSWKNI